MLIENIHEKTYFSRKLYCNGIIPLTPSKESSESVSLDSSSSKSLTKAQAGSNTPPSNTECGGVQGKNLEIPTLVSPMSPSWPTIEVSDLVRRHSLSLHNRTPPPRSLCAELLRTCDTKDRQQNLLSDIQDIAASISDFNSCFSSNSSAEDSESSRSASKKTSKTRKRKKTPVKDDPVKKAS